MVIPVMGYGKENSADCYSCCCCSWMLSLSQWHGPLLFFCHTTLMYIIPSGNCNWLYVAISVDWKAWGLAFLFINLSLIITFLCKIIHVYFCISLSKCSYFSQAKPKALVFNAILTRFREKLWFTDCTDFKLISWLLLLFIYVYICIFLFF